MCDAGRAPPAQRGWLSGQAPGDSARFELHESLGAGSARGCGSSAAGVEVDPLGERSPALYILALNSHVAAPAPVAQVEEKT